MSKAPLALRRSLGAHLVEKGGDSQSIDEVFGLDVLHLALYFSAEWAPNNRTIVDHLLKVNDKVSTKFVLISVDEDEDAFQRQLDGVPWKAVPFTEVKRRLRLLRQFRMSNLPFLVVLNARTGNTLSRVGSEILLEDPSSKGFPWITPSVGDIMKNMELVDPSGSSVPATSLQGKVLGLYFSANWCPPCRSFTHQLTNIYKSLTSENKNFEIVFVSSDRTVESFKSCHSSMPWPGIPWDKQNPRRDLEKALEIKGIPTLVLLDVDYSVITREGRYFVTEDFKAEKFPWRPQTVEHLQPFHIPFITKSPTLIYFTDGECEEIQFAKDILQPTAEKYFSENFDDSGMQLKFYVAGEDDASDEVRAMASLDDVIPLLVIVDLVERSKYLMQEGIELSNATVHDFVTKYTNDELEPTAISEHESQKQQQPQMFFGSNMESGKTKLDDSIELNLIEEIL